MNNNQCKNKDCTCNPCHCEPCNCGKNNKLIKKILMFTVLGLMMFTLAACDNNSVNNTPLSDGAIRTELTVWGMTCGACVQRITNIVTQFDGIIDVTVDMRADRVTIIHDEETDIEGIKEAIIDFGYNIP